jgi:hypothetical protein
MDSPCAVGETHSSLLGESAKPRRTLAKRLRNQVRKLQKMNEMMERKTPPNFFVSAADGLEEILGCYAAGVTLALPPGIMALTIT